MSYKQNRLKSRTRFRVDEGEYRMFFSHYDDDGTRRTIAPPLPNCRDQRVWVGVDGEEIGRYDMHELSSGMRQMIEAFNNDLPQLDARW